MDMKLKFKKQPYQEEAARSVCDVFAGQPNTGPDTYLHDAGFLVGRRGQGMLFGGQTVADLGYGNAAVALPTQQLLANLRAVQRRNDIPESPELWRKEKGVGVCSLDVEMETGTGKTYVYTKTMLELNRLYGWSKFIVVVPSVAIREGVSSSVKATEQHFYEQYGKVVHAFVYDSANLGRLDDFAQSPEIQCMIINMQAFNAEMKDPGDAKAGKKKGRGQARIIFDVRDEFGSRRPIDVIARTRPIVIMDEPQKMGGKATKEGLAKFDPLFTLNYSATHKEAHDTVYALDAVDAYNQRLVKRIEVKGFELKNMRGTDGYLYLRDIVTSKNAAPVAVIEHKAMGRNGAVKKVTSRLGELDSVYEASGETRLEAYRDFQIKPSGVVADAEGIGGYVEFMNGVTLHRGEVYGDSAGDDMRRVQIRETVRSHLEKEESLFAQGVKCLSLFFIDEVAKYLSADGSKSGQYAQIFEEEYASEVESLLEGRPEDAYSRYLRGISPRATHDGYFSQDKKGNSVESKKLKKEEESLGLGANDDDARRGYQLILRDKTRLLSLDEPLRFIFSHSALSEGWDNPNVFQICQLRTSNSETRRRQEVGRGLRLCVNQDGDRQDASVLGDRGVHEVNVLTVVAPEAFATYAEGLQSEMREGLRKRQAKVTDAFFDGKTVSAGDGATVVIARAAASKLYKFLIKNDLIDDDDLPSERFRESGLSGTPELPDGLEPYRAHIEAMVRSVFDPKALAGMIDDGNTAKVRTNRLNGNQLRPEFLELWKRINRKRAYTVSFDDEELRRKAIAAIDSGLEVSRVSYTMTVGRQAEQASREDVEGRTHIAAGRRATEELDLAPASNVRYDLVGEVAQAARITRRSAAAILKGIRPEKFAMFAQNPEEFIAKAGKLIVGVKASTVVEHVEYRTLDDEYDLDIFIEKMPASLSKAIRTEKAIQDWASCDSEQERAFVRDLETADEVCVFARLPRSFQIPTPVGNYAPDWAIAFNEGATKHVYFVAETKGTMDSSELRPVEQAKIDCATKLFNGLASGDVRYGFVDGYDALLSKISNME